MPYDNQARVPTDQQAARQSCPAATLRRVLLYLTTVLIVGSSLACALFSPDGQHEPPPADTNATTPAAAVPTTTPGSAVVPDGTAVPGAR